MSFKPLTLSVLGTGYLGATHAACMAELGHTVIGYDISPEKVAILNEGKLPFHEPGLDVIVERNVANGRLRFTSDISELAAATVHFVCVGTPQQVNSLAADLSQVEGAIKSLAPYLTDGSLIVGKSTVPVGTAEHLTSFLADLTSKQVELAWNPEFLREGFAVEDTLHPDRLVYGFKDIENETARNILDQVYSKQLEENTPVIVTDLPTAELVKVSANSFLATKISFINAIAEVCEQSGADVTKIAEAIGLDDRIGPKFLAAGLGFGGGCLGKDIRAFIARADELGAGEAVNFLKEVDTINNRRREKTVDLVLEAAGDKLHNVHVTVLGGAFKPNSDDIRDSASLAVVKTLSAKGINVTVHDPAALENINKAFPAIRTEDNLDVAIKNADILVLATEWDNYKNFIPSNVAGKHRTVIDARNALDPALWRAAGYEYQALGRPNA